MKKDWSHIEGSRVTTGFYASAPGDDFGMFGINHGKKFFKIIASSGNEEIPWEHVSVSSKDYSGDRTPTWEEMHWIKQLFWDDEECVIQFHPKKSEYVNNHAHCLHMWKPIGIEFPTPPSIAVGIK